VIPKSVLLTGGAGFIGRWVARELLRGGSGPARFDPPRVAVLDNLENGAEANLAEFAGDPRLAEFVVGDIADRRLIARLFAQHRFDLVLHLSGSSRPTWRERFTCWKRRGKPARPSRS
jgi:nucleoside-diphosphate-sugar epimerase